ncbi:arginase family protein [Sphingosinicella sp. LHD-64]|uniref:arginase family protein n=1 Tax=Sphingosinicella sp. LHD-64 TaxID=3072139 RepID=UPI00280E560C|nr:arginase family protein [Sphingosinicella sp. LHD-64]MDQ8755016.1 arginase family protein [Sphingosinicella sp. LHD-64]
MRSIALIGAPSSAGAYAPGQEKAPEALRRAGLVDRLSAAGFACRDFGDVEGFRWRADPASPLAMNVAQVAAVASAVAAQVRRARSANLLPLVVGGDCTIELGTLAGSFAPSHRTGLIYFDLDADLNTPETTPDGALDWMGVAHMLGLPGAVDRLTKIGPRRPMLVPEDLLLFGAGNITAPEQAVIDQRAIEIIDVAAVGADPASAAARAVAWAGSFDQVLIHFDVDVIDYENFPLAENVRRKCGITVDAAMTALTILLSADNLAGLTVCEVNPDHGAEGGATIVDFANRLAGSFGGAGA